MIIVLLGWMWHAPCWPPLVFFCGTCVSTALTQNPCARRACIYVCMQDPELMAAAGYRSLHAAPPAIPICGMCRHLVPLSSTLISLDIMDNYVDADDWHQICSQLTLLTVSSLLSEAAYSAQWQASGTHSSYLKLGCHLSRTHKLTAQAPTSTTHQSPRQV